MNHQLLNFFFERIKSNERNQANLETNRWITFWEFKNEKTLNLFSGFWLIHKKHKFNFTNNFVQDHQMVHALKPKKQSQGFL